MLKRVLPDHLLGGMHLGDDEERGAQTRYDLLVTMFGSLERLRAEISKCSAEPYLLTVTGSDRPHCGTVTVGWDAPGCRLVVRPPSSWARSEASGRRQVSLLWPPTEPDGYSLIVDGVASAVVSDGETLLAIELTKAVLHRRGPGLPGNGSSCGSDCVPILTR